MSIDRTLLFNLATSRRLERSIKAVPGGEDATWRAASRYVAGRSREEVLCTADGLLAAGHGVSVDLFGELVTDPPARPTVSPISTGRSRRHCHRCRPMRGWQWT